MTAVRCLSGFNRHAVAFCAGLALTLIAATSASGQVLVVAPHPDDDVITSAGVLARALGRGVAVRVIYMTNGDYNGTSVGLQREGEAVNGQGEVGLVEDQLIFLGYPDAGLETIRTSYRSSSSAYRSVAGRTTTYGNRGLGRKDYHTYRYGTAGRYNWPNIVGDLADFIATFRPTHILTTAGSDQHSDHSTTFQAVSEAAKQVIASYPGYNPTVHKTFVWPLDGCWPSPPDATAYFSEITKLAGTGLTWANRESLDVPLPMQVVDLPSNQKGKAIDAHQTQGGISPGPYCAAYDLVSFIHKDEFFWTEQFVAGTYAPVPNAGTDRAVSGGAFVTLQGTGSRNPGGKPLTYAWRQSAGPAVVLSNPAAASPTFTAPNVTTTLAFELVVSNGPLASLADAVSVVVSSGPVNVAPVADAGPDQSVAPGATVQLTGAGSTDANGDVLTYQWTQIDGPTVTLAGAASVQPSFVAPGVTQATVLTFSLTVRDGSLSSEADTVSVTVQPVAGSGSNIASLAAVTASSENSSTGQLAIKAVDGVADGYPGDYTKEWATSGQRAGAWIQLTWTSGYSIDHVRLHDRPNLNERILTGTLSFSDGSTVAVGSLDNAGAGLDVSFPARTATWVRFTINSVSSSSVNIGLAEFLVFTTASNVAPVANAGPDQSVTSGANVQLNGSGSTDVNGDALTYAWTQTAGPTVALGGATTAGPTFVAPSTTQSIALTFSLTVSDGSLSSAPDTVTITVQPAPAPAVTLSPSSLTFASQAISTTSAGQTVTLTNSGSGPLTISSFGLGGANSADFGYTSTCGGSLSAGASCTFTITFKPTATGSRTASLTISDNATGSPHSASLTGTGIAGAPAVSLSPSSLTFASQIVGTTSAGKTVTLTNSGSAALSISSVSLTGANSGDFARTTTCGASLAAGANCTATVTFTPTATGTRTASLTISDNATGSPHSVGLTGTGGAGTPAVSLSPTSLTFSGQVGTTSAGQTVTLTNSGTAALSISSVSVTGANSGDFARTTTCGASLAAGANCTATVTFTPTATGARTASLTITDNAAGSPHSVGLTGTGVAAGPGNIAALATVTASSQNTSTGQLAVKAVDGVIDGYPGDYAREWATAGQKAGAWIQLTFAGSYAIDRVRLHDRPNSNDQILTGTLSFSDGSTVAVGALTNSGAGVDVTFSARTVTWVRFTVNSVSAASQNIGLSEILVFGSAAAPAPTSEPAPAFTTIAEALTPGAGLMVAEPAFSAPVNFDASTTHDSPVQATTNQPPTSVPTSRSLEKGRASP